MFAIFRTRMGGAALGAALLCVTASASAEAPPQSGCSNPQALGTARDLVVGDPVEVGLKTYPRSLALQDHEVILTFDDGPWPRTTPKILDALEAACVKASFFLIGRNAAASPGLVQREVADGHSVGHHSWSHPALTLRGLSDDAALSDIERGMKADDIAAYGSWSGKPHVPFFRFPGFADTKPLLEHLKAQDISVFGADLWASDWVPMTPEAEFDRVTSRLTAAGRGIILLHDTKAQTADMLPRLLDWLKQEDYHVVHLVPGEGPTPTVAAEPGWTSETERILQHVWPKIQKLSSSAALKQTQ